jgi:hypothetical protein
MEAVSIEIFVIIDCFFEFDFCGIESGTCHRCLAFRKSHAFMSKAAILLDSFCYKVLPDRETTFQSFVHSSSLSQS